jgi:hypothetical protein
LAPIFKIFLSFWSKLRTPIYFPFLAKSPRNRIPPPPQFPQQGPYGDTRLQGIFTSLLIYIFNISFGVPSKGALPPGPPHGVPSERDATFLEPPSSIFQSPW